MSYNLGDVVPLSVRITDAAGQPADAGAVTLTVTLPDGTTDVTANIASTSAGVYDHDYVTTQAGVHQVRWVATGANASAYEDAFSVGSAAGQNFISLAETKKHLKKDLTKTADDAELGEFITAACTKIVEMIGPVAPENVVQIGLPVRPGGTIVLDYHPVIEVMTVTVNAPDGQEIPEADPGNGVSGWSLDAGAGLLNHTGRWPCSSIQIAYRAGRTPLPGNVRLAALELAGHLWKQSQLNNGAGRPPITGDDQVIVAGVAYALPIRVRELLGLGRNQTADVLVG